MSRPKTVRVNGDRLKQAVKRKGMTRRQFALSCLEYMARFDMATLPEDIGDREKKASSWFSLLCRPDTDPRKTGINPEALKWIAWIMLEVRIEWLTGESDIMTDSDLLQHIVARENAQLQAAADECSTLVNPLLKKAGIEYQCPCFVDGRAAALFEGRDHHEYTVTAEDLQMIESACIDLCASLLRAHAVKGSC